MTKNRKRNKGREFWMNTVKLRQAANAALSGNAVVIEGPNGKRAREFEKKWRDASYIRSEWLK